MDVHPHPQEKGSKARGQYIASKEHAQEVTGRFLSMVAENRQTSFHHLRNFGCQLKTRERHPMLPWKL
jgi:hypothetical protein